MTAGTLPLAARLRAAVAYLGFWTLVGLFFAGETYLAGMVVGRAVTWGAAVAYSLAGWYVWAALAPGIVGLGRVVPMRRGRLTFGLVFHVTAGALAALVHASLAVGAERVLGLGTALATGYGDALRLRLRIGSHLDVITYWAILLTSYALAYWRREQERELASSRAAAALAEARLELLRVQLDPHFLFNALNAIAGMVHFDPAAADRMIARLSELLRFSLEERGRQEVPLREELRLLEAYAAIERVRFGKRLEISVEVEAELHEMLVPSLLLQPLVENAIRHGIAPRPGPGRVQVTAARLGSTLEIVVRDDGVGLTGDAGDVAEAGARGGFGLDNTRARLAQLYGDAHRLQIVEGDAGGLVVRLTIPLRGSGATTPAARPGAEAGHPGGATSAARPTEVAR